MSKRSLSHDLFDAVVKEPVKQLGGGLLQEMARQAFGLQSPKKKKEGGGGHVHNHYHIYPDKKYYRPGK